MCNLLMFFLENKLNQSNQINVSFEKHVYYYVMVSSTLKSTESK